MVGLYVANDSDDSDSLGGSDMDVDNGPGSAVCPYLSAGNLL
jgi:hypothetical protein